MELCNILIYKKKIVNILSYIYDINFEICTKIPKNFIDCKKSKK